MASTIQWFGDLPGSSMADRPHSHDSAAPTSPPSRLHAELSALVVELAGTTMGKEIPIRVQDLVDTVPRLTGGFFYRCVYEIVRVHDQHRLAVTQVSILQNLPRGIFRGLK